MRKPLRLHQILTIATVVFTVVGDVFWLTTVLQGANKNAAWTIWALTNALVVGITAAIAWDAHK